MKEGSEYRRDQEGGGIRAEKGSQGGGGSGLRRDQGEGVIRSEEESISRKDKEWGDQDKEGSEWRRDKEGSGWRRDQDGE